MGISRNHFSITLTCHVVPQGLAACVNLVPQEELVESNSSDMASAARCTSGETRLVDRRRWVGSWWLLMK